MTTPSSTVTEVMIEPLTAEAFAPFGTVIGPTRDDASFGPADAQLELGNGTPRFYTMTIAARGLEFGSITRHRRVTQVLASAGGNEWLIGLAAASGDVAEVDPGTIRAFRIPGDFAIMLAVGTWHAGPLFSEGTQSFFNLELSDTNQVDHQSDHFGARLGVTVRLVDPV